MNRHERRKQKQVAKPSKGAATDVGQTFALALDHHRAGRLAEAEPLYRQVLATAPAHADSLHLLGVIAYQKGALETAATLMSQSILINGNQASCLNNLGLTLQTLGRLDEAVARYCEALRLKPDFADALYNLGNALRDQGKLEAAIARYHQALRSRPDYYEALNNLAAVLKQLGRTDEAVAICHQALRTRADCHQALNNLGVLLLEQGKTDEAIEKFRRALQIAPDYLDALNNLANGFRDQGKLDDAIARFLEVQRLQPDQPDANWGESLTRLIQGDFETGWQKYEWRWLTKGSVAHGRPEPPWRGEPLDGKTILLHCEQGFGDCLQFIRYAEAVKARGGSVVLLAPTELERLFRSASGIDRLVTGFAEIPPCDYQAPLGSLPLRFETRLATIPANVPYLAAEPSSVLAWQRRLPASAGPKVGISWRGRPTHRDDRNRSISPAVWATLLGAGAGSFFSLQKGPRTGDLERLAGHPNFLDLSADLVDFAETAALIENLDLVLSVDTSIAHLAGALGKPVWILLPFAPDWRWLLHRSDSPWYPTARLFRQGNPGDWTSVIDQVAAALAEFRNPDGEGSGG
ncbi:MAG: tetratricopeptide repeat protein [Azospirillum sp.]|nr:tetratricopeptide repeat protein [Azospirillum sp.]